MFTLVEMHTFDLSIGFTHDLKTWNLEFNDYILMIPNFQIMCNH